jgi:hypothetical protein
LEVCFQVQRHNIRSQKNCKSVILSSATIY